MRRRGSDEDYRLIAEEYERGFFDIDQTSCLLR